MQILLTCKCFLDFLRDHILLEELLKFLRNLSFNELRSGSKGVVSVFELREGEEVKSKSKKNNILTFVSKKLPKMIIFYSFLV